MSKAYEAPTTRVYAMESIDFLLNLSGGTKNPTNGGDPTTPGTNPTPNPFGTSRSFHLDAEWEESGE